MSILDSFELIDDHKERPFLTLRSSSITFSKMAIESLEYSEYVHMFLDRKSARFAIQACKADSSAISFYKEQEGKNLLVRWTNKEKAAMLGQFIDLNQYPKGVRVFGTFYPEENCIVFDLKDYEAAGRS